MPLGLVLPPDFASPFEFGALVTSSPHTPYILGPDGKLVKEENKKEDVDTLEMEESKDSVDLSSSSPYTSNIVVSETEVKLKMDKVDYSRLVQCKMLHIQMTRSTTR